MPSRYHHILYIFLACGFTGSLSRATGQALVILSWQVPVSLNSIHSTTPSVFWRSGQSSSDAGSSVRILYSCPAGTVLLSGNGLPVGFIRVYRRLVLITGLLRYRVCLQLLPAYKKHGQFMFPLFFGEFQ